MIEHKHWCLQPRSDSPKRLKAKGHIFVDAFTKAFATFACARVTQKVIRVLAREEKGSSENVIAVRLITVRARVTPNKVEIPDQQSQMLSK